MSRDVTEVQSLLVKPFLSPNSSEQATTATKAVRTRDNCLGSCVEGLTFLH